MRVVSFDLSLTGTGVADSASPTEPYVLAPPRALRGWPRVEWIQRKAQPLLDAADVAVFEGYAYGSKTNATSAGELGGIIRYTAWCLRTPYVNIAPATLKKLATGVGKGKKSGVLVEAVKRLGYMGSSTDAADALWLLQAALHHYGLPGAVPLPAKHTETLHRIDWPQLGVAA